MNVTRFPRPFGTTPLMVEYHKTKDPALLKKVKDTLINHWLINNGYLCGTPYTINKLAIILNVELRDIRIIMRNQILNAKIWQADHQKEMVEAMMGEQLSWILEDRMAASQQFELLKEAQGDTYKPFVSAEVNKAMKLKLETTNNLSQVIKSFIGGSNFNINIDNSETNVETHTNNITIEEARMLIMDTHKELFTDKSHELKLLETQYDLGSLPEVCATKQLGVDTSKEGLNFNNTELNLIMDDYKGAMAESTKVSHDMRREIMERMDPNEPEPELSIYEDLDDEPDTFSAENFLIPT